MQQVFVWRLEDIGAVIVFTLLSLALIVWLLAWMIGVVQRNWRRLFVCWWGGCGGTIDSDSQGVRWKCPRCGRIRR